MIYMILGDGSRVVIIEPANIEKLREGKPLVSPDGHLMINFTPDGEFTAGLITRMAKDTAVLDPELMEFIMSESLKRPEVKR